MRAFGWIHGPDKGPGAQISNGFRGQQIQPLADQNFGNDVLAARSKVANLLGVKPPEIFFLDVQNCFRVLEFLTSMANSHNNPESGKRLVMRTVPHIDERGCIQNIAQISYALKKSNPYELPAVIVESLGTLGQISSKLLRVSELGCDGFVTSPFQDLGCNISAVYLKPSLLQMIFGTNKLDKIEVCKDLKGLSIESLRRGVIPGDLLKHVVGPDSRAKVNDNHSFITDVDPYLHDPIMQASIPLLYAYLRFIEDETLEELHRNLLKAWHVLRVGLSVHENVEVFWHEDILDTLYPGVLRFKILEKSADKLRAFVRDLNRFGVSSKYFEESNMIQINLSTGESEAEALAKLKIIEGTIVILNNS